MNFEKKYLKYKSKYFNLKSKTNYESNKKIEIIPIKWQLNYNQYVAGIASAKNPEELYMSINSPVEYVMSKIPKIDIKPIIDKAVKNVNMNYEKKINKVDKVDKVDKIKTDFKKNTKKEDKCEKGNNDIEKCLDIRGCSYWRGGKCRELGRGPPESVLEEMKRIGK
jgi:hypothetical protein